MDLPALITLAQGSAPDALHFMEFAKSMGFMISLALNAGALVLLFAGRNKAQQRVVTFGNEFVTKEAYSAAQAQIERRLQCLEEILSHDEERAVALHNRINPIVENTAEIKGRMEAFAQSFDNFTKLLVAQKKS